MINKKCISCSGKSRFQCQKCNEAVCKDCIRFVDSSQFPLAPELTRKLPHSAYCPACFDLEARGLFDAYEETVTRAQEVFVYEKTQGKETRFLKRAEKPVRVEDGVDRSEVVLRLAYAAAALGYNGLVDVEVVPKKIRDGSYQTTRWTGVGIPTQIEESRLMKDRSFKHNPN